MENYNNGNEGQSGTPSENENSQSQSGRGNDQQNSENEASGAEVNFNTPNQETSETEMGDGMPGNQSRDSSFSQDGQESYQVGHQQSGNSNGADLGSDDDPAQAPESGTL